MVTGASCLSDANSLALTRQGAGQWSASSWYIPTDGRAIPETIYPIAPEAVFYISNPPDGSAERDAIEWMEREGVIVINRSLHGSFEAPGDGNPYAGQSNTDIHNLRYIMQKRGSEVLFVNSAGNHGRFTWYGPYADSNSNRKVDMRVYSNSVGDYNYTGSGVKGAEADCYGSGE